MARILIFHGYLLAGTGSNVYNARLAATLARLGHDVHLLCQERHPERLEFVGGAGDWDSGTLRVRRLRDPPPAPGRRRVRRGAAPSTDLTSADCCRCTWPTAMRGWRPAPSRS